MQTLATPSLPAYSGVFAAPVCPMHDDQSLDEGGMEKYLNWLLSRQAIAGLVVNVHAGEATFIGQEDRTRVIEIARKVVPSSRKLVTGVCGNSTREMIQQIKSAEAAGADAAIVIPFREWQTSRAPGHAEAFYKRLGEETSLPLVIFQSSVAKYDTNTLARILEVPSIVAIKQAVTDVALYQEQYRAIRAARPDVAILSAYDAALFPTLAIGADGVLLGIAGSLPDLVIGLFEAAQAGNYEKAKEFAAELAPMSHYLFGVHPRALRHVRTKAMLKLLGILDSDMVREPLLPLDEVERSKLTQAMQSAGMLGEKSAQSTATVRSPHLIPA